MKDSIHKYFQIGTIQWMSHPPVSYEVVDSVKTIACDDFFDAIEIGPFKDTAKGSSEKDLGTGPHESVLRGPATASGTRIKSQ